HSFPTRRSSDLVYRQGYGYHRACCAQGDRGGRGGRYPAHPDGDSAEAGQARSGGYHLPAPRGGRPHGEGGEICDLAGVRIECRTLVKGPELLRARYRNLFQSEWSKLVSRVERVIV